MNKELIVDGFLFANMEDANEARLEKEKIIKLNDKLKHCDKDLLYKVYNKSLEKKTFKTPIGYAFLQDLRLKLIDLDYEVDKILPVPVLANEVYIKPVIKEEDTKKSNPNSKWFIMIIAMLVIVIIAMFVIMGTSDKPTIIDYENKIINRYASWEQELNERELQINIREKELGIY